jgi:hypothetical protein
VTIRLGRDHARRIQRVAYLLTIHGVLEVLTAGVVAVYLYVPRDGNPHPWLPLLLPAFAATAGVLKAVAGRANQRYRGRGLGMAALLTAPLALGTVACFPTAVLLSAYGLWVYRHPTVRRAFELGASGQAPADVEAALKRKEA